MTEWQPIDTAPKDGTDILAYLEWTDKSGEIRVIRWDEEMEVWWGDYAYDPDDEFEYPTHWMPLPAPPKKGDV